MRCVGGGVWEGQRGDKEPIDAPVCRLESQGAGGARDRFCVVKVLFALCSRGGGGRGRSTRAMRSTARAARGSALAHAATEGRCTIAAAQFQ